ncbi:MAG: hypothetical protein M1147_06180 [Nitrospirae bacterium]|nr:hypothetical protein [Nitrospirota bacterium]MCL5977704.1 hypothetical protein [Nitrospirota bacterium]
MPDKNLNQTGQPHGINESVLSHVQTRKDTQHSEPNAGTGDPTDGRNEYEWETKYPKPAKIEIRLESIYLFVIFLLSNFTIFAIWIGWGYSWLSLTPEQATTFQRFAFYAAAGMLGGVTFGIKYFYRVVARGYWHQDRRIWRLMSPFLSMTIAFVVGLMLDASMITSTPPSSGSAILAIGFLSGYFADSAVAKMYEVAEVVFGKSAATKASDGK